jgi:hypothetical protein
MQEVSLFPRGMQLFLTIWGVVGPMAGVGFGHYLSASSERKRWIADNEKDEYRKLLAALTKVNLALCSLRSGHENLQPIYEALSEFSQACGTCLFVNDFLEKSKLGGEIHEAVQLALKGGDFKDFQKKYWAAVHELIASAKRIKA